MKFRIGARLAVSAGTGILFVAGMMLNRQTADSADETTRSDRAQKVFAVKDSAVALQRVRVVYRDVKPARDAASAPSLSPESHQLRREVDTFLSTVRAA